MLSGYIRLRQARGFDGVYLSPDSLVLGRLEPYVFPVLAANPGRDASADGFEHVLSGVDISRAHCTVLGEVATKDSRVGANVAEVDGLSSSFE